PEPSPVCCGEATSRTGTSSRSANEVWTTKVCAQRRTSRARRPVKWLDSEYFTLQGWGLPPLRRKFFPLAVYKLDSGLKMSRPQSRERNRETETRELATATAVPPAVPPDTCFPPSIPD